MSTSGGSRLEDWEIAIVKAMLARGGWNDQTILAHFTRPTRSINHRVIGEIRTGKKHAEVEVATAEMLDAFLARWPDFDPQTGLSIRTDELLIKAREAMIAAVTVFNGAGLHFRAELFITTAVIAWTYLMHAYFRREGVDFRHREKGSVALTDNGAEKFWELGKCLRVNACPLDKPVRMNLEFLLGIRHEIEHRSTDRIDDALAAELQACCINFNAALTKLFGAQYALDRRLPIALQFGAFTPDQKAMLKRAESLPRNIGAMITAFEGRHQRGDLDDPQFAYRVAFQPVAINKTARADEIVPIAKAAPGEVTDVSRIYLKEVEKAKYRPGKIVEMMKAEGYSRFNMHHHTTLWKTLGAMDPAKGFGAKVSDGAWYWYDNWVERVRQHCTENAALFAK